MSSSVLSEILPSVNWKGDTALHVAAKEGHTFVIRALLQHAEKLDKEEPEKGLNIVKEILTLSNEVGDTALHKALRSSVVSPVPETRGNEITATLREKFGNLRRAVTDCGKQESPRQVVDDLRMLIYPNYPYSSNENGETPLYLAAEAECNHQLVTKIAEAAGSNYGGPGGRTALHAAVITNNQENTEFMLNWNKDLARESDMKGWTPLHYAAEFGYSQRVKQLVAFDELLGYQITEEEEYRDTALHIAAREGHVSVLKEFVLMCPGSWDIVNERGQNMLHVAVEVKKTQVIEFFHQMPSLLSLLREKDRDGNTPHDIAAKDYDVLGYFPKEYSTLKTYWNENWNPIEQSAYWSNCPTMKQQAEEECLKKGSVMQVHRGALSLSTRQMKGYRPRYKDKKKIAQVHGADDDSQEKPEIEGATAEKRAKENYKYLDKVRSTHLIVVTLVATAAFAVGISVPGGYNGKEGPNQGVPLLLKQAAFNAFVVADVSAMIISTCAILLYLGSALTKGNIHLAELQFSMAWTATFFSVTFLVLAFATGSYAVLAHLPPLAITILAIAIISVALLEYSVLLSEY